MNAATIYLLKIMAIIESFRTLVYLFINISIVRCLQNMNSNGQY